MCKVLRQVSGPNGTAGIFSTYPQAFLSSSEGFVDQLLGTALLALIVMGVTDPRNMTHKELSQALAPLLVGATVFGIGVSYGFNCGYAINPARDLGPR